MLTLADTHTHIHAHSASPSQLIFKRQYSNCVVASRSYIAIHSATQHWRVGGCSGPGWQVMSRSRSLQCDVSPLSPTLIVKVSAPRLCVCVCKLVTQRYFADKEEYGSMVVCRRDLLNLGNASNIAMDHCSTGRAGCISI